jgi:hypothetical protein
MKSADCSETTELLRAVESAGRARLVPFALNPGTVLPDIEVPGFKLITTKLADALGEIFRIAPRSFLGAVVALEDGKLTLTVWSSAGESHSLPPESADQLGTMLGMAGIRIASTMAPYNAALALSQWGLPGPEQAALAIARSSANDQRFSAATRAACASLAGYIEFKRNELKSAQSYAEHALKLVPDHPLATLLVCVISEPLDGAQKNCIDLVWRASEPFAEDYFPQLSAYFDGIYRERIRRLANTLVEALFNIHERFIKRSDKRLQFLCQHGGGETFRCHRQHR